MALARIKARQPSRSFILTGSRGIGKTALLHTIERIARAEGFRTVYVEGVVSSRLSALLVAPLRPAIAGLSSAPRARPATANALRELHGFATQFARGRARRRVRRGDVREALPELLATVGRAAQAADAAVALFVDDSHLVAPECVEALLLAMQRAGHQGAPLIVFAAALSSFDPARSAARAAMERRFVEVPLTPLAADAAARAFEDPIAREGATIEPDALAALVRESGGHPCFVQRWGWEVWNVASGSPITLADVQQARPRVVAALDREFYAVGLEQLAPREQEYLRAMAALGPGPHRSGDIAALLGMPVTGAAHRRHVLIRKGLLFSPRRGETAFAAPGLDDHLRRAMPDWTPRGGRRPR